ncbi:hypothetical protein HT102_15630 [Hoyosella sp. G463]|uniref:Mce/MlaD domain-containing protein n=1 Tax=Lolliginicoccus lacisalsi TaxID=2742202 RepID=A0A927PN91_9ACTN|nr:MCE family protein [Lolliginicoccus lacisalsi]MBD8507919.1 hypothetical protein [Lolliginicoccus lacisalsi]
MIKPARKLAIAGLLIMPTTMAVAGCSVGMQNIDFDAIQGREVYPLEVELETADLLMVGSEVRLGQQMLGRVTDLSTDVASDGRRIAVASISLPADVELPRNATITVELPNTLGNPYLRVRMPEDEAPAAPYQPEERVPESQTFRGPDLENALASLAMVLSEGGVGSLEVIANEMELAIGGRGDDIRRTVAALRDTAQILESRSEDIDRILVAASNASARIAAEQETFDNSLDAALPVFDQLIDQWDEIADLLARLASMSGELDQVMTASEADLLALPAELAELLEALERTDIRSVIVPLSALLDQLDDARAGDYLRIDADADVPELLNNLVVGGQPIQTGGGR